MIIWRLGKKEHKESTCTYICIKLIASAIETQDEGARCAAWRGHITAIGMSITRGWSAFGSQTPGEDEGTGNAEVVVQEEGPTANGSDEVRTHVIGKPNNLDSSEASTEGQAFHDK